MKYILYTAVFFLICKVGKAQDSVSYEIKIANIDFDAKYGEDIRAWNWGPDYTFVVYNSDDQIGQGRRQVSYFIHNRATNALITFKDTLESSSVFLYAEMYDSVAVLGFVEANGFFRVRKISHPSFGLTLSGYGLNLKDYKLILSDILPQKKHDVFYGESQGGVPARLYLDKAGQFVKFKTLLNPEYRFIKAIGTTEGQMSLYLKDLEKTGKLIVENGPDFEEVYSFNTLNDLALRELYFEKRGSTGILAGLLSKRGDSDLSSGIYLNAETVRKQYFPWIDLIGYEESLPKGRAKRVRKKLKDDPNNLYIEDRAAKISEYSLLADGSVLLSGMFVNKQSNQNQNTANISQGNYRMLWSLNGSNNPSDTRASYQSFVPSFLPYWKKSEDLMLYTIDDGFVLHIKPSGRAEFSTWEMEKPYLPYFSIMPVYTTGGLYQDDPIMLSMTEEEFTFYTLDITKSVNIDSLLELNYPGSRYDNFRLGGLTAIDQKSFLAVSLYTIKGVGKPFRRFTLFTIKLKD